jgi:hypothetical protein
LPAGFVNLALQNLLEAPTGDGAPFESFAERMIKEAGFVWPIENQDNAHEILRGLIEYVVIKPLVDYEILEIEYQPNKILGGEYLDLAKFRITPFGKGLLEAIKETLR